ncbi:ribonuclease Y, partial [Myxococcota bacterium]|nr:ribonuclease Y [Myxococcota bacterium]
MVDLITPLAASVAGLVLGIGGYWLKLRAETGGLQAEADRIRGDAEKDKIQMLRDAEIEAKEELLKVQEGHENDSKKLRDELAGSEKRLRHRETNVDRKNELLDRRDRQLKKRENAIAAAEQKTKKSIEDAEGRLKEADVELERVAGLSQEAAREELIETIRVEARRQAAVQVMRIHEEAEGEAKERANSILANTIQRMAGEFVSEHTISVVELPSDDMKGRIIGREGRNIRSIEAATGVDVIIDDTPEVVLLSGFNPVRREIARRSMERLVADGRIHPARIEEVVAKVRNEMDGLIRQTGEQATFDLGIHGLHNELIELLGRLKFRTSNGQNQWDHAVESANIAGMLAAEVGANQNLAKRAALLHDIGKSVDHESEGTHADVGADMARRFGEKAAVVEAIRQHHDPAPTTLIATLVQAADRLSKARPGARRDQVEAFIKRLEDLERISLSFNGVAQAFAIQAGREIRVMVNYEKVSDAEAYMLSSDIA